MDHRPTVPGAPRAKRRAARVAAAAVVLFVLGAGAALAWTFGTTNPDNSVTARVLGSAGTATLTRTPTTGASCTSVNLTWNAAAGADRYLVERNRTGTWETVAASQTTTTLVDTPSPAFNNLTVDYRVTPILSTSANWRGPASLAEVTCGVGDVDDLALTSTCNTNTLTWGAQPGATRYDIFRGIGTATPTSVKANHVGTTWTDTTLHATGAKVTYYVRSDAAGGTAPASNSVVNPAFNPFRVMSIAFRNAGAANTLNQGDAIDVTFSQPSNGSTPSGTNSGNIWIQPTGTTRGIYLSATSASSLNTAIGRAQFSANITGTAAAGMYGGVGTWNEDNTVWTWTRNTATTYTLSAPTAWAAGFTIGTKASAPARVKCSDGSNLTAVSTPTESGWF